MTQYTTTAFAPWTDEQVKGIRRYQRDPSVHPFTCGECGSRKPLRVTNEGLSCACGYTQGWVHGWMVAWEIQPNPLERTDG